MAAHNMTEAERTFEPTSVPGVGDHAAALLALATSGWRQAVLAVAGRLELAAMLGARSADLEEVCYSLGIARQPTQLFLAACEGLGLVVEGDGEYCLGPVGHALRASPGGVLADWAAAAGDSRGAAAGWGALHLPRLGDAPVAGGSPAPGPAALAALCLPYGHTPAADAARAWAALQALHGPAAAALAGMLPSVPGSLVLESGGQGIYAGAFLARDAQLRAALADVAPWAVAGSEGGPVSADGRVRTLGTLEALGDERAALAVLAQTARALPLGALRAGLTQLASYLAVDPSVVVVGPFRSGTGRSLAPLLALLELAAGG